MGEVAQTKLKQLIWLRDIKEKIEKLVKVDTHQICILQTKYPQVLNNG